MNDNKVDISYIDIGYIWSQDFMDAFLNMLNHFEIEKCKESQEKLFINMKIEIVNAYRELQGKIKDLPLIMKCRVKCDKDSNFGGQQCFIFASKVEHSITKYLNESKFIDADNIQDGTLASALKQVKDKADNDRSYASNFEKETKQKYLNSNKDNTLDIFIKSGYKF